MLTLLFLLLFPVALVATASAQTPRQVQDRVDAILVSLLPDIAAKRPSNWQGLRTPASVPVNGADVAPDTTRKPPDQAQSWADINVALPKTVPFSIEVFTHTSRSGTGYTVISTIIVGKQRFDRWDGFGVGSTTRPWTALRQ